jgi:pyridoxal phosphate enzyme (YggS family)
MVTVDAAAIAANLANVRARLAAACERSGRPAEAVRLVAVTKTFPADAVVAAWSAGQRDFGENRVQEAAEKVPQVAARGVDATWHLIGHLQTNKVRPAVELFDIIQSIDTLRLAQAVSARVSAKIGVLLEVNVAGEASKSGFAPPQLAGAVAQIRTLPGLEVQGLMTIAPQVADPEEVRPVFRELATLARRLELPELSMGMSGDFEVAVEEGATVVRVGTAIFGHR